jgi:hypothetical protein
MDVKISAAPDVVFDQLARFGDYKLDGNNLERVEGDTVFYVLRQCVWDRYHRLTAEFEAESAAGKKVWP